jgi:histidinol-phosphate aminotransferase
MRKAFDFIKPQIKEVSAYTLRQYNYQIKINQNENPFDLPREIKEKILTYALERSWSRYPDFVPTDLLQKLARHIGWRRDGVLAGNGSNELIQAILMTTVGPGTRVVIPTPTFTLYRLLGKILGAEIVEVPLTSEYTFDVPAIRQVVTTQKIDLLIICSPNNPTGCSLSLSDLRTILDESDTLVVLDQAYIEFGGENAVPLLEDYDRLIVLRTFSKAMSMAGLRIGYMAAAPEATREISKAKLPYNLNFFSQAAAIAILDHLDLLSERIADIQEQREEVYRSLHAIPGVRPYPSHTNFILFEVERLPEEVFEELVKRGILIRDVSHYPMLSKALRVSIGTEEENQRFLTALREVMTQ